MCRKYWLILSFGVLLVVCSFLTMQGRPIVFSDLQPAKTDLVAAGFFCTSDREDGKVGFGFMITRDHTDWRDIATMQKIGAMESDWQGKVWVTKIGSRFELQSTPERGASRVWGNVLAFGDPAFLDEIERNLRRQNSTTDEHNWTQMFRSELIRS
jgi:hypothetical protein